MWRQIMSEHYNIRFSMTNWFIYISPIKLNLTKMQGSVRIMRLARFRGSIKIWMNNLVWAIRYMALQKKKEKKNTLHCMKIDEMDGDASDFESTDIKCVKNLSDYIPSKSKQRFVLNHSLFMTLWKRYLEVISLWILLWCLKAWAQDKQRVV